MDYYMDKFQRLLLVNQFEILSKIDAENGSDYEKKIEILKGGYELHYDDDVLDQILDPLSEEDCTFVIDVLHMYRDINYSKSKLDPSDQEKIESHNHSFLGFDYNDPKEIKLASYAEFFIKKLERFQELVEDEEFAGFNSHQTMKSTYQRYLNNYNKVKSYNNYQFGKLSVDLLNEIFAY